MKPTWKQGDILAMPQDLQARGGDAISRGCAVFVAEHDPELVHGTWCYGLRPASELRPATVEDIERLVGIVWDDLEREAKELARLTAVRQQLKENSR